LAFILDQVDDALEVTLERSAAGFGITLAPKRSSMVFTEKVEVRADLVHLVDEADAGHVVLVGLPPDLLGLRLDTLLAVETATAPSSTRRLRSTSTVKSTCPGVDDVDLVVVPEAVVARR